MEQSSDRENFDPEHRTPGNLQGHLWAPEPPPSFPAGCNDSEGSTRQSSPLWRPSPCRCAVCCCLSTLPGPSHLEQDLLSGGKYYCFFGHLFDPPESIFAEISRVSCSSAVVYDSVPIPLDSSPFWATEGGEGTFQQQWVPNCLGQDMEEGLGSGRLRLSPLDYEVPDWSFLSK